MARRITPQEKAEVVEYHNQKVLVDPLHRQKDTIDHFASRFSITKSSLNRWVLSNAALDKQVSKRDTRATKDHWKDIEIDPVETAKLRVINMTISSVIQHYLETQHQNLQVKVSDDLIRAIIGSIKESIPDLQVPDFELIQILISQVNVDHLLRLIQDIKLVKRQYNSLHKETIRFHRISKPYALDNVYHFNEITIHINDLIKLTNPPVLDSFKPNHYVTIGIGCNFSATHFLDPIIVSNFGVNDSITMYRNHSGFMSNFLFNEYTSALNTKLKTERKKILLVVSPDSSHIMANNHSHIKLYYQNLRNFPLDFGIDNLILKNLSLRICNFLKSQSRPDLIPPLMKTSTSNLISKFLEQPNYSRFWKHCNKLSLNYGNSNNYLKLIKDKNSDDIYFSRKSNSLALVNNEKFCKEWSKLLKLPQSHTYKPYIPSYDLKTTITSNFIADAKCEVTDLEFPRLLQYRTSLERKDVSDTTVKAFDAFMESFSRDINGFKFKELDDWKEVLDKTTDSELDSDLTGKKATGGSASTNSLTTGATGNTGNTGTANEPIQLPLEHAPNSPIEEVSPVEITQENEYMSLDQSEEEEEHTGPRVMQYNIPNRKYSGSSYRSYRSASTGSGFSFTRRSDDVLESDNAVESSDEETADRKRRFRQSLEQLSEVSESFIEERSVKFMKTFRSDSNHSRSTAE